MTIHETKETIAAWIKSCETNGQFDLCFDIVLCFITGRYVDHQEMQRVEDELMELIKTEKAFKLGFS